MKDTNLYNLFQCFVLLLVIVACLLLQTALEPTGIYSIVLPVAVGLTVSTWAFNKDLKVYLNSIDPSNNITLVRLLLTIFRLFYIFLFSVVAIVCYQTGSYIVSVIGLYLTYSSIIDLIKGSD